MLCIFSDYSTTIGARYLLSIMTIYRQLSPNVLQSKHFITAHTHAKTNDYLVYLSSLTKRRRVKNELKDRAFHARVYRKKRRTQDENLRKLQKDDDDEAVKKFGDVEIKTNEINDQFRRSINEGAVEGYDVKTHKLVDALSMWRKTMSLEDGEQKAQSGYVGLDGKQCKPFTLTAKSFFDGVKRHPTHTGLRGMGFNYNVLREKVKKIKDRVLETHRGDADANFIDLYAIMQLSQV